MGTVLIAVGIVALFIIGVAIMLKAYVRWINKESKQKVFSASTPKVEPSRPEALEEFVHRRDREERMTRISEENDSGLGDNGIF